MSTLLAAETALLTACRAYAAGTTFTTTNSSRDDWSVIDAATTSLVIEMGGPTVEGDVIDGYGTHGTYQERHELRITVLRKVGTGESGAAAIIQGLKTTVEALKNHLRTTRLAGAARDAIPVRTSPVLERLVSRGGAPTHVLQQITLSVWCESELP